jgi:hypothetical protein
MRDHRVTDGGWLIASSRLSVSAALTLLLLVACGTTSEDDGDDLASDADAGADTDLGADADLNEGDCEGVAGATAVGPEGGVLEFEDVWLVIPPGALSTATTVCMLASNASVPDVTTYSPVLSLRPAGLVFDEPVTVSFPKPAEDVSLAVFWSRPADEPGVMQQLPSFVRGDRIEAFARHFSVVYLAAPNSAQSSIACCTPQDPSLYTDDQCLYAPNACDTSICTLSPGTCPAPTNPCCSAIDSADDYLPLGCANILVATECTSGPPGDHCQWNATCGPDVTPPLPCCAVVNPASPPPGSGPCVSQTAYGDCTGLAPYCQWNASAACVVPDPCCVPIDPLNDLPGAGCGALGPYQLCVHTPQC